MKTLARIPLKLLFLMLMVLFFFLLFGAIWDWSAGYIPGKGFDFSYLARRVPLFFAHSYFLAIITTLFLFYVDPKKLPASRILAYLIPLGIGFVLMIFFPLPSQQTLSSFTPQTTGVENIRQGILSRVESSLIFAQEIEGFKLENVVFIDLTKIPEVSTSLKEYEQATSKDKDFAAIQKRWRDAAFKVFDQGNYDPEQEQFTFPLYNFHEKAAKRNPVLSEVLSPPSYLASIWRDMTSLNQHLLALRERNRQLFYLYALAVLLLCVAAGMFTRLTSWPLVNFFIYIFMIRFYFYLDRFLKEAEGLFHELFAHFISTDLISIIIYSALAALLFLWDLLFIPYKDRISRQSVDEP